MQAFQNYFRARDKLSIPANHSLQIHRIPSFIKKGAQADQSQRLITLLNQMLLPIARSVALRGQNIDYSFSLEVTNNALVTQWAIPWSIELRPEKTALIARIDHFFYLMALSNATKINIAPEQPFTLTGLTEEQASTIKQDGFKPLLPQFTPAGYTQEWIGLPAPSGCQLLQLQQRYQLKITSPKFMSVYLKKTTIYQTQIDQLFLQMTASCCSKTTMALKEALTLSDVTDEEEKVFREKDFHFSFFELVQRRIPAGFVLDEWSPLPEPAQCQFTKLPVGYQLQVMPITPITISVKKLHFFSNFERLVTTIGPSKELILQDHEKLEISCDFPFVLLLKDYEKYLLELYISKLDFVLNQFSLTAEFGISAQIPGEYTLSYDPNDSKLELVLDEGDFLALILQPKKIIAKSSYLEKYLFNLLNDPKFAGEEPKFTFQRNEKLILYGFSYDELLTLAPADLSQREKRQRLNALFFKHSPHLGFCLQIDEQHDVDLTLLVLEEGDDNPATLLQIRGKAGFSLRNKKEEDLLQIALQILNLSHPQLLESLIDRDFNAMAFLLFQILLYYCCTLRQFPMDGVIGLYLAAKTVQKMNALVKNPNFISDCEIIDRTYKLQVKFSQISKSTPEEFMDLDLQDFDREELPLKRVMESLRNIIHGEYQGGKFAQTVINFLLKNLAHPNEWPVREFLLHPPPLSKLPQEEIEASKASAVAAESADFLSEMGSFLRRLKNRWFSQ